MKSTKAHKTEAPKETGPLAFSVPDAAAHIGVSRSGIFRLLNAGTLRAARVGGRTLIMRSELEDMLRRCGGAG